MFRTLLVPVLLFTQALAAQVLMPATTRVGLDELRLIALRTTDPQKLTELTEGYYPTAMMHGRCMVGFLGKAQGALAPSAEDESSLTWGARKGNIISFRVDVYHLEAVSGLVGLEYIELAGKAAPNLDKLVKAIHADSVQQGINLPQTYTGRNVLIGITDWGFDYTHPMFYDTAMTYSRVRAAWDQFRQAGPAPAGFGYGTELTTPAELLAAQADTVNIYSYATHGSHVAGIAGGGGAGTNYRGVAFDAQFVFTTFLVDAAAVLDAFAWMQNIAEQDGKRLVINMSWGLYYIGTLDGNSLISQAINQFSQEGVVFSNSGGNNGDVNFHIRKDFAGDTLRSRLQFYSYSANPNMWGQSISMWGEPGEEISAGFTITNNTYQAVQQSPWYHTATQAAYLDSFMVQGADTVYFNLTSEAAHPLNGRPFFRLRVKNRSATWKIVLKATAPSGIVHFHNLTELTNGVGNWGQPFIASQTGWTAGDAQYGIGEPACTESLVTVAAYNSEYWSGGTQFGGAIAGFSSYGPTIDERRKPDITAPGVSVASSISSFTDNDFTPVASVDFQGRTYPFARFSGTSMSSPAVTGTIALMLEADPTLSASDVKEIIKLTARTDNNTGVIPAEGSTRWGRGKLNAYHAVVEALGVVSVEEHASSDLALWPNPVSSELQVAIPRTNGIVRSTVTDLAGRAVLTGSYGAGGVISMDASGLPSGMYLIQLQHEGRTMTTKFIKE